MICAQYDLMFTTSFLHKDHKLVHYSHGAISTLCGKLSSRKSADLWEIIRAWYWSGWLMIHAENLQMIATYMIGVRVNEHNMSGLIFTHSYILHILQLCYAQYDIYYYCFYFLYGWLCFFMANVIDYLIIYP